MVALSAVLVARFPQAVGPPTLVEIDRLVTDSISYVDELNRPGSATLSCTLEAASSDVRNRLVDLRANPSEVWIYADDQIAWAGEVQSLQVQGQSVSLNCVGLLGYTYRMGITDDLTFTGEDQFEIARSLISAWQAKTYGNFGIVIPDSGNSGVLRDRTYLRNDLKDVGSTLVELGSVLNGFDLHVRPDTRELVLSYPQRGEDLSNAVVMDSRSIDSADVVQSIAPDDLVSDIGVTSSAQSEGGEQTSLYSYRTNTAVLLSYGRSWRGQSASDISVQATLDDRGDSYLAARAQQLLQPGLTLVPSIATGATVGGFGPGDQVAYVFDAGLGVQTGTYRVAKVTTSIDNGGKQRLGVEFT